MTEEGMVKERLLEQIRWLNRQLYPLALFRDGRQE